MMDKQRLRTFLLGGAAGALAGILLAPRSGRELRGSIASRAEEAREQGRESYFEAQERMRERFAQSREGPRPAAPEREVTVGPSGNAPDQEQPRPPLRDVTFEETEPPEGASGREAGAAGPEELRRRVREARARLRRDRTDAGEGGEPERDE